MTYATSLERVGHLEQAARLLNILLNSKFGQVPDWATIKINDADVESIEHWAKKALHLSFLKDVFFEFQESQVFLPKPSKADVRLTKEIIKFEKSINKDYLLSLFLNSMQQQAANMFNMLLKSKFGQVPDWAVVKINAASVESIEAWTERIPHIGTLKDVCENLNESLNLGTA